MLPRHSIGMAHQMTHHAIIQVIRLHAYTPHFVQFTPTHIIQLTANAYSTVVGVDGSDLYVAAFNTLSTKDRKMVVLDDQNRSHGLSYLTQLVISAKKNKSFKKTWRLHRPGDGQTLIIVDVFS